MMPDATFFPSPGLTDGQVRGLGVLELAYIGDSVYDVYVRGTLTLKGYKAHDMHVRAVAAVNAHAQARTLEALLPHLTKEELSVVRRGRNAHARHSAPKGVSYEEYAAATALEALIGQIYLTGRMDRLNELMRLAQSFQEVSP